MGFQKGHEPYNDWGKINERFKTDPKFKEKWLKSKIGQVAWNNGLSLRDYKNGIKRGKDHGNFKNGCDKMRNRLFPGYKRFVKDTLKKYDYTCQECGLNRGMLHVHHVVPISKDINGILDSSNVTVLCVPCHKSIHSAKSSGN